MSDFGSFMDRKSERAFRRTTNRAAFEIGGREFDAFGQPLQVYAENGDKAEVYVDGVQLEAVTWADARRGLIFYRRNGDDFSAEHQIDPGRIRIESTSLTFSVGAAKAHILAASIGGSVTHENRIS